MWVKYFNFISLHALDINECVLGGTYNECEVQSRCSNIVGDYACGCNPGDEIEADGRNCRGKYGMWNCKSTYYFYLYGKKINQFIYVQLKIYQNISVYSCFFDVLNVSDKIIY